MNTNHPTLRAAEAAVRTARAASSDDPDRHGEALATALLALGERLEADDRRAEALDATEEAVRVIAPPFLRAPKRHAATVRAAVARYLALSTMTGRAVDRTLLAPIAQALGSVMRMEDDLDDSQP